MARSDVQRRGGPQVLSLLRRFGITKVPPGMSIEQAVSPVANVPRIDNMAGGNALIASDVGNRSLIEIFNPVGSGVEVILHKIWVSLSAAGRVSLRTHNVALADPVTSLSVLSRRPGNQPEPSAQMRSLQGSAVGSSILAWALDIADRSYEFDLQRIDDAQEFYGPSLAEGFGFIVTPSSDNVANSTALVWSERISR